MWGRVRGSSQVMLVAVLACLFLMMVTAAGVRADPATGREAFNRGNFDAAEAEYRPLAEAGNAAGEFGLGQVYEQGRGDYKRAEIWYAKAAEHGSIEARYRLALIALAGNRDLPPDPVTAYKWAILASDGKDEWGQLAADLRGLLREHISAAEQVDGKKQADAWQELRNPKPKPPVASVLNTAPPVFAPPIAPAPGIAPTPNPPGLPPLPGPKLPWTNKEILPPIPGQPAQPHPTLFATPPPGLGQAPGSNPTEDLTRLLTRIDCASLRNTTNAQGRLVISGTVPDENEKAKLIRVSSDLMQGSHPELDIHVMPPPLCRSLVQFDSMRATALASEGLEARLAGGASVLRDGDPIRIEVKAGSYPAHLRIDYFTLDGTVVHMAPSPAQPIVWLGAHKKQIFGDGPTAAAPFGTEFIAVTATPQPIEFQPPRPEGEPADQYLRDLESALRRAKTAGAQPSLVATVLVRTSPK